MRVLCLRSVSGLPLVSRLSCSEAFVLSGSRSFPQVPDPLFGGLPDDGQECQGEHCEGDVAVPGAVEADLVVIESGFAFRCLGAFFDGPSRSRYADQFPAGSCRGL